MEKPPTPVVSWPMTPLPRATDSSTTREWSPPTRRVLWTCREAEALQRAVQWCEQMGLIFDAVNDNIPEIVMHYGTNSRKISCDYYIDDKMLLMKGVKYSTGVV